VPFEDITFEDNSSVIKLIAGKRTGMLPMLDEEGRVPRGSDSSWFNKVKKRYESKRAEKNWAKAKALTGKKTIAKTLVLAKSQMNSEDNEVSKRFEVKFDDFIIVHYAGRVKYRVAGFMNKNKDTISPDLLRLPLTSPNSFVQTLMKTKDDDDDDDKDDLSSSSSSSSSRGSSRGKHGSNKKRGNKKTFSECVYKQLNQ